MASSSAAPAPTVAKISTRCNLYYKTSTGGDWIKLEQVLPGRDNAVITMDGTVMFHQQYTKHVKGSQGLYRYSVTYEADQISSGATQYTEDDPDEPEGTIMRMADVHVNPLLTATPKSKSSVEGEPFTMQGFSSPDNFPLARVFREFKEIKCVIRHCDNVKSWDLNAVYYFLRGNRGYNKNTDDRAYLTGQRLAMEAESEAERQRLQAFKGCRIDFGPFGESGALLLECFPSVLNGVLDLKKEQLAKTYVIEHAGLPDPLNYPIPGQLEAATSWIGQMVDLPTSSAPINLLLKNYIPPQELAQWNVRPSIYGATLDYVWFDPSTVFGTSAIQKLGADMEGLEREQWTQTRESDMVLPFDNLPVSSMLPLRNIFVARYPAHVEKSPEPLTSPPLHPAYGLNPSQAESLRNCVEYPFSIIHGPPATGKSHTLACLMHHVLAGDRAERILVATPTNVAADALLKKVTELFQQLKTGVRIVRVYSEMQIAADYASKHANLLDPYHIQNVRISLAKAQARQYRVFLVGVEKLQRHGLIVSPQEFKAYQKERLELDKVIMSKADIVFATCIGAHMVGIKEWPATICLLDEAGCGKDHEILLPLAMFPTLKRAVLAGDPYQLGPTIFSMPGREAWSSTVLDKNIDKGAITALLNVQYRTHSKLYRHTSNGIYQARVQSFWQTSQPRPFLQLLLAALPIVVPGTTGDFVLTQWSHCLNVNGQTVVDESGSSTNLEEAQICSNLVRRLLEIPGIEQRQILVLTGYRRMVEDLRSYAKRFQWAGVRVEETVKTIDSSQGAEAEILILCCVRSHGSMGFMQQRSRANVATSRQREAMFIIGRWYFITGMTKSEKKNWMGALLLGLKESVGNGFVVNETNSSTNSDSDSALRVATV